jgi:GxxExxY protein
VSAIAQVAEIAEIAEIAKKTDDWRWEAMMAYEEEIPPYGDLLQPPAEVNELARVVIGIALEVHRELGAGLPEEAYERGLAMEFDARGTRCRRQHRIVVCYKGKPVTSVRRDFLVEEKLVLEAKSCEAITPIDRKQVVRYLRITQLPLGLLINFNVMMLKDGIHRIFQSERSA